MPPCQGECHGFESRSVLFVIKGLKMARPKKQENQVVQTPEESLSEVLAPEYTSEKLGSMNLEDIPGVDVIAATIGFVSVFDEKTFSPNVHLILRINETTRKTASSYSLETIQDAIAFGCKVDSLVSYFKTHTSSYEFTDTDAMKKELKNLDSFYARDFSRFYDELAKSNYHLRNEITVSTLLTTIHEKSQLPVLIEVRK